MDSISLSAETTYKLKLSKANGTLNPTTQSNFRSLSQGYGTVGATTGTVNVVWFSSHELAASGTYDIDLDAASVNTIDSADNVLVTMTQFHVQLVSNADGSTPSTGISVKGKTGDGARMMLLVTEQGFTVPRLGYLSWGSDYGISPKESAKKTIRFTNLDASNKATFEILITGRNA